MLYDRPDPHGLIILLAGSQERDAYRSAAEPLLARLRPAPSVPRELILFVARTQLEAPQADRGRPAGRKQLVSSPGIHPT
jgi:hypothetical protein